MKLIRKIQILGSPSLTLFIQEVNKIPSIDSFNNRGFVVNTLLCSCIEYIRSSILDVPRVIDIDTILSDIQDIMPSVSISLESLDLMRGYLLEIADELSKEIALSILDSSVIFEVMTRLNMYIDIYIYDISPIERIDNANRK